MTVKPFSTYPEDHAKLLALANKICEDTNMGHEDLLKLAVALADLVQATLRDEALDAEATQPAAPDLLAALQAVAMDAVSIGSRENAISDNTLALVDAALSRATEAAQ